MSKVLPMHFDLVSVMIANAQYYRIQEDMGLRKIHIYEFSHLNIVYTLLRKRKLLWFVQNGKVDGWDDPRFPIVQSIVNCVQRSAN
ncbi:hypothetical protein AgCh_022149 [Apium graveolens]